jgi:hypothetical protein
MRTKEILWCLYPMMALTSIGCGMLDGGRDHSGLDTDPPAACSELGEADCLGRTDCQPIYVGVGCACPACFGEGCPPCDCPPPTEEFAGCTDRDPCEGLAEDVCVATEGCEAYYGPDPCPLADLAAPCLPGEDCSGGCDQTIHFQGCFSAPEPGPCDGLSEDECIAAPNCEPIYGGGGCVCPECVPGEMCPPCDCTDGAGLRAPPPGDPNDPTSPVPPPPHEYLGCYETLGCPEILCDVWCEYGYVYDRNGCQTCECQPPPHGGCCEGLGERECHSTPGCVAEYVSTCSEWCDPDGQCWICDATGACYPREEAHTCQCEEVFAGCHAGNVCPAIACDIWCEWGYVVDQNGCETCECLPPREECPPVCDIACEFGNVIDERGCELCECNPPPDGTGGSGGK